MFCYAQWGMGMSFNMLYTGSTRQVIPSILHVLRASPLLVVQCYMYIVHVVVLQHVQCYHIVHVVAAGSRFHCAGMFISLYINLPHPIPSVQLSLCDASHVQIDHKSL